MTILLLLSITSNYFILKERGCEKFFKIPNPLEDFYLDDIINFEHSEKS